MTINVTISGDTPTSVQLVSISPSISGLSLPASLAASGSTWSITLAAPASSYSYTAVVTWQDGTTDTVPGVKAGDGPSLSPPATTLLYGRITKQGVGQAGVSITIEQQGSPAGGAGQFDAQAITATTAADGSWSAIVLQSTSYAITVSGRTKLVTTKTDPTTLAPSMIYADGD
ncbi:MAG: hypothetical protein JO353_06055 [Phycisphaerae bacterium]|nr:hypothetical protein [Phycisphaerae bacterium]